MTRNNGQSPDDTTAPKGFSATDPDVQEIVNRVHDQYPALVNCYPGGNTTFDTIDLLPNTPPTRGELIERIAARGLTAEQVSHLDTGTRAAITGLPSAVVTHQDQPHFGPQATSYERPPADHIG